MTRLLRRIFALLALGLCACNVGGGGGGGAALTPKPIAPYTPALPLTDAAVRGAHLYNTQGCVLCHGAAGQGGVENPNSDTGGKINGLTLVKEGYTPDQLVKKIHSGVPTVARAGNKGPTPPFRMPVYGALLASPQIDDLCAYLLSLYPKDRVAADDWDEDE